MPSLVSIRKIGAWLSGIDRAVSKPRPSEVLQFLAAYKGVSNYDLAPRGCPNHVWVGDPRSDHCFTQGLRRKT